MSTQIVEFYLSQLDEVDAEQVTCDKFEISTTTLEMILINDLWETFSDLEE